MVTEKLEIISSIVMNGVIAASGLSALCYFFVRLRYLFPDLSRSKAKEVAEIEKLLARGANALLENGFKRSSKEYGFALLNLLGRYSRWRSNRHVRRQLGDVLLRSLHECCKSISTAKKDVNLANRILEMLIAIKARDLQFSRLVFPSVQFPKCRLRYWKFVECDLRLLDIKSRVTFIQNQGDSTFDSLGKKTVEKKFHLWEDKRARRIVVRRRGNRRRRSKLADRRNRRLASS